MKNLFTYQQYVIMSAKILSESAETKMGYDISEEGDSVLLKPWYINTDNQERVYFQDVIVERDKIVSDNEPIVSELEKKVAELKKEFENNRNDFLIKFNRVLRT